MRKEQSFGCVQSVISIKYSNDLYKITYQVILKSHLRDFSGDPGDDYLPPLQEVLGSSPGQRTKIPNATWCSQKKKVTSKNYIIRNVIQHDRKSKRRNQVKIKMISP